MIRRSGQMRIIITLLFFLVCIPDAYGDIAFVANTDGNWDIFSANDDGKNPVRLTATPYDEKTPCWSSDRKNIVYATSDGHLNILNTFSGKTHQIAANQNSTPSITPAFSPDDREIAYAWFIPGKRDDTELMIFNRETNTVRKLLDQPSVQTNPAWSPDAKRLIYTTVHCTSDCGRIIQELWITDPKGGWSQQLLMTHSLCQQPVWSPDGKQIAFSSDKSGNFDIWVLSLEDWNLRQITVHESLDVSPAWSPDGSRIAFISARSGIMEIWIKDLKRDKLIKLSPFGDKNIECRDVAW